MAAREYKNRDGKKVPSVTQIIGSNLGWSKHALMWWSWNEGREGRDYKETRDKAADAGSLAHAMVEAAIKGLPSPSLKDVPEDIQRKALASFEAYKAFESMSRLVMVGSEISLVSERYLFGGTIDCIATVDGRLALIDLKTSNDTHSDHILQVSAYTALFEEAGTRPEGIEAIQLTGGVHILRFSKDSAAFHHTHIPREVILGVPFDVFIRLRAIHGMRKEVEGLC